MIIGAFYLTELVEGAKGEGRVFRHLHEVERAYEEGDARPARPDRVPHAAARRHAGQRPAATYDTTTPVACFFNQALPDDFRRSSYINERVDKRRSWASIVDDAGRRLPEGRRGRQPRRHQEPLLPLRRQSGLTVSIDDVKTPAEKAAILDRHEKEADKVENAVPPGHHHRRRAAPEGSRDLDRRHRRGADGDGGDAQGRSSSTPST